MTLRLALLLLSFLVPAALPAGTVQFVLYAVESAGADQFPPEVMAGSAPLTAHLQKLKEERKALTPLEVSGEFKWSTNLTLEAGETLDYAKSFTATDEILKPDQRASRTLGYTINLRARRETDGDARLQLAFEWTPSFDRIPIPRAGDDAWLPKFHTIKSDTTTTSGPGEPIVAALWRTTFSLTAKDQPRPRELYLVVTWTDDPAE